MAIKTETFAERVKVAEKEQNLPAIKEIAEELLEAVEGCEDITDKRVLESELDEVINTYTGISKAKCYAAAKASGDAMKYAIKEFFFPVIKVKETKDKDTDTVIRSIIEAERPIDLGDMHKKLGGIGADTNWIYRAEKFNYHLTIRAAERVGAKVKSDAFAMNEVSRAIEMGKNPCSNTQMLKTLQSIVDMMLGTKEDGSQYKAVSHDVNYLVDCYSNDNKKSKTSITAANHKTLRHYLKKVCYRILTDGKGYDCEQREIKESK